MKYLFSGVAVTCLAATMAHAAGDATKGEKDFRQCRACHSIIADDGTAIVKGGKIGPNLYGVVGRTAGSWDDFPYSSYLKAAGEKGLAWDEEHFADWVQDPSKFLKGYLGDNAARAKMTFKLRRASEAPDIWAYLESVGPHT